MSPLCLLHLAPLLLTASPSQQPAQVVKPFAHPGVLIDAAQLAFASQQVTAGVQPFAETFETLKKDRYDDIANSIKNNVDTVPDICALEQL